jgi:hypothetical protein
MAVQTTGNFPKALRPGVKEWWGQSYTENDAVFTRIFDEQSSDKSYEELVEGTYFGLAPVKPQGDATAYDTAQQGVVNRGTHVAYASGFIITHEAIKDNLYMELAAARTKALAFSMKQTKEVLGANILNRATTAGYVYGDGQTLLSTAHPTRAGSQSNTLAVAADLSEASLEDLCVQIMKAKNSRGLNIKLMPTDLIVPSDLAFEAQRILKSTLQSGTANNDVNALKDMGMIPNIIVSPYLTDTDAWFVKTNAPAGLTYFNREATEIDQDNDFDTKNAKFAAYFRCSFTMGDFRTIYGSIGS